MEDDTRTAALRGDLFEVAVKRGCLGYLRHRGLLAPASRARRTWAEPTVNDLHQHLIAQTGVVDPSYRARQASGLEHMLLAGWGLGWTALREYLRRLPRTEVEVRALFCPLELRDRRTAAATPPDPGERLEALWTELGLAGTPDERWGAKGEPANADFLLLVRTPERRHLLCLEFSLDAGPGDADFAAEAAHLDEVARYVRRVGARGVFTRLAAEVTGERFLLSERLVSHLPALTTRDKPLYKLCQGSSYASRLIHLLGRRGAGLEPVTAQVVAVTNAGLEALSARFDGPGAADPRARLMAALGAAYRRSGVERDDPSTLTDEIRAVQSQVARSLPAALRAAFEEGLAAAPTDRMDVRQEERVTEFVNPAAGLPRGDLLRWMDDTPPEVDELLGRAARDAVVGELDRWVPGRPTVSLRDLHAAAIRAGLRAAPPGQVTVVAAEGHPGIGKTTAVLDHLGSLGPEQGYLFFYASPRIVINSEVTRRIARGDGGRPTGVLTLTTNSRLIRAAPTWWRHQRQHEARGERKHAAVVADGVPGFRVPDGSILFLEPDLAREIDENQSSASLRKETWSERDDVMRGAAAPGVLGTLARAARRSLEANPGLNRLVLTAAVQGFRDREGAGSTVDRLTELFRYPADAPRGLAERRDLARRLPTVVVMVDEIAGDGAGGPFVHAVAGWLQRELVVPFAAVGETSPFTVVLVLADASLGNDHVLTNYLLTSVEAPEKVLVSDSAGRRPFRLAAGRLRLGGRTLRVLHVMADGFPARSLVLDYRVRLTPVRARLGQDGRAASRRTAILEQEGEAQLRQAVEEVFAALERTPAGEQVIFFAQDKRFLRDVRRGLVAPHLLTGSHDPRQAPVETCGVVLTEGDIGLLDSSVPEWQRRHLIAPALRDGKRVFLMTSSGARGVSFPLATTVIALVPTFAVESGFMEIAQLAYRGRGRTRGVDGDYLDRRIVLVLHDFVVADEPIDERAWLRRKIDLVSALVLLRATLLTRVTGDAGIPRQRAAVVPVGRIGVEETATTLSASIGALLAEGKVYLRETVPAYLRTLVDGALEDTEALFRDFRWTVRPAGGQTTVASPRALSAVRAQVCSPAAPLLPGDGALPEDTFGLGALWMERWTGVPSQEGFRFGALAARHAERMRRLVAACARIARRPDLPLHLKRAARDVRDILDRPSGLQDLDFSVRQLPASRSAWGCLPVDYVRFRNRMSGHEGEQPARLEDPVYWLEVLGRAGAASASPTAILPVLPYFQEHPFVVLLGRGDPTGLGRVFDDRYFMASTELNLLNTLLFVAENGARPDDGP